MVGAGSVRRRSYVVRCPVKALTQPDRPGEMDTSIRPLAVRLAHIWRTTSGGALARPLRLSFPASTGPRKSSAVPTGRHNDYIEHAGRLGPGRHGARGRRLGCCWASAWSRPGGRVRSSQRLGAKSGSNKFAFRAWRSLGLCGPAVPLGRRFQYADSRQRHSRRIALMALLSGIYALRPTAIGWALPPGPKCLPARC